jgi:hypothetical protein
VLVNVLANLIAAAVVYLVGALGVTRSGRAGRMIRSSGVNALSGSRLDGRPGR